jgi:predicted metal-binding membrane protein
MAAARSPLAHFPTTSSATASNCLATAAPCAIVRDSNRFRSSNALGSNPMMGGTSPLLGSLLLMTAGVYQLTPVKQACLRHCRTPLQFLLTCWQDGTAGAFLMALCHGAYCLGCCWLLMAILFAVGVMNLVWIAALSVLVLVEKIIPRGFSVAKAAGLLLVGWGGWMAFSGGA